MNAQTKTLTQTKWTGRPVLVFDSLDSTNDEAKRRADAGADAGLLVIAEEQTAGRGRRGRAWESMRGEGLFMSLLLRPDIPPERAPMLTLVMGLAVRDALAEACDVDARIKWPNDIVTDERKLCGILSEMNSEKRTVHHVVIGVGINMYQQTFPEVLEQTATSIARQTGQLVDRDELVAMCMCRFEEDYATFLATRDMSGLMERYNAHLVNRGRDVRILDDSGEVSGMARGINARGELLVDTADGPRAVSSGEVSVRGVYGYV